MENLFDTHTLGNLTLANRIVMAPMTRSRAINNIPNQLMAEYYGQRAAAGLIITEGTSPSPNGLGYARIPGIFSEEQVKGWQNVTAAVHEKGGKIFLQIMHTGRIGHPLNLPAGESLVAPSAVKPETTRMWVDTEGLKEIPQPRELRTEEVRSVIKEHVTAAENAIRAGFDGVELHGANGYLIKQFLNPHTNRRTDEYGGNIENRSRFLLEVTEEIAKAIGKGKVGVRISPFSTFNDMPAYPETEATYLYIARKLNELSVAYLHVTDPAAKGEPHMLVHHLRKNFGNTLILSGGYTATSAETALKENHADLVSFARAFIPNPDLVERFKNKLPLNQPKFDLFYTPGPQGYIDYPVFQDVQVI
jgi:N-ethylmaleimide reductase